MIRPIAWLLLILGVQVALSHLSLHAAGSETRPNILLVMADDQGWGDMAYNGHPHVKTPHFDQFASEGVRFDRFYAAAPVCSPTRGSVLTGRHPNRFGCFKWGYSLRPQEITIAEALKTKGYGTGHFGKWHLGSCQPGSPVNPGASGFDQWLSAENFYDNHPILSDKGRAVEVRGESSMIAVDAAIEFITSQQSSSTPFLAVVWFGSPHSPHEALDEDRQLYSQMSAADQSFLGEITAMDRAFGKLRSTIEELGLKENTLLWYCSDNGALPKVGSTGGFRGNKGSIYDGGLLVPAVLEWPANIRQPQVISTRGNTCDIYATLLDAVGLEMENQLPLDGISLLPLLEGNVSVRGRAMGFWDYPAPGIGVPSDQWMRELLEAQARGLETADTKRLRLDASEIKVTYAEDDFSGHSAWIDGDWKLHHIVNAKTGSAKWELYDLAEDPREERDLFQPADERCAAMQSDLIHWQTNVLHSLNGADYRDSQKE